MFEDGIYWFHSMVGFSFGVLIQLTKPWMVFQKFHVILKPVIYCYFWNFPYFRMNLKCITTKQRNRNLGNGRSKFKSLGEWDFNIIHYVWLIGNKLATLHWKWSATVSILDKIVNLLLDFYNFRNGVMENA